MNVTIPEITEFLQNLEEQLPKRRTRNLYLMDSEYTRESDSAISVNRQKLLEMIKLLKLIEVAHARLPAGVSLTGSPVLASLASCSYVTFATMGDARTLTLNVSKIDNMSLSHPCVWDNKFKFRQNLICSWPMNPEITDRCCGCCAPDSPAILPPVNCIRYLCACSNRCTCTSLRLPRKFGGTQVLITRKLGSYALLNHFEYENYVGFKAFYTANPKFIIRTISGLTIDYAAYYNLPPTKYQVTPDGIITEFAPGGIPLDPIVVADFGLARYEYQAKEWDSQAIDAIREVIGMEPSFKRLPNK